MSEYLINSSTLTGIASAIRGKTGTTSAFTPAQMISAINNIPTVETKTAIPPYAYQSSTIVSYTGSEDYVLYHAFYSCVELTTASFSNCTVLDTAAFAFCSSLTTISFPNCSYIGPSAFYYCSSLTTASFPNCSYIGSGAFSRCFSLTTASFPYCSYIGNNTFARCSILSSLYLDKVSSVTSVAISTFNSSPLSSGGTGKIYVPSSLYAAFCTATNWSVVSARLVSI